MGAFGDEEVVISGDPARRDRLARPYRCGFGRFRVLERDARRRIRFWRHGLTPPHVVAGIKVFDGKGNLTQRDYGGNSVPAEFAPPGQETGTYTVDPDCTGSMVINLNVPSGGGELQILFVISAGGRHIHEVVSQFTPPFGSGPVPAQTSADDWKMAPEQNTQEQKWSSIPIRQPALAARR
jgi:hypothetical protein